MKLRAEEEAVENVSGLLRLYDLRTKTQNRILTGRIMPMADAVEEKFPQAGFPLTEKARCGGKQKVPHSP